MSMKARCLAVALLALVSCATPAAPPQPVRTPSSSPSTVVASPTPSPAAGSLEAAIAQIDPAKLDVHMRALAAFRSRDPRHVGHDRARQYILDQLRVIEGIQVGLFQTAEPVTMISVIVTINPLDPPTGGFFPGLICAHYDSTAIRTPNWMPASDPAPGADDDATGVAALLEYARILAGNRALLKMPIVLAFFDGHHTALRGSSRYAQMVVRNQKPKWVIEVNTVGFNPIADRLDLVSYEDHSTKLRDRARAANDRYAIGVSPLVDQPSTTENSVYDAASFGLYVIPALMLTERYGDPDASYPGNPARRTVNDTPDRVTNKSLWLKAAKLGLATALELAGSAPL